MKRREFVKKAALGAVAGGVLTACKRAEDVGAPAIHTAPRVRWNLASSFGPSLDVLYGSCQLLAKRVNALTDGRFDIRVYGAGELVPSMQVMDAVQQGTVEVGQSPSYWFVGKNPALIFDTCVPFGLTARQQVAWMVHGGGQELMREVFADFNIIPFTAGGTGAQMGGWFRREIGSVSDLRGLRMRIPAMGGEVMSRMGVSVQVLSGAEVYPALERGVVDAVEWVGPHDDEKLGFHRVARYYYYPGWWEPGATLTLMVNRRAWDRLPSLYQEAFTVAAAEVSQDMLARYDVKNPQALDRLLSAGVQLRRFSDDIIATGRVTTDERMAELAARDALFNRIYEQWKAFRETSYRWFAVAEHSFTDIAFPKV